MVEGPDARSTRTGRGADDGASARAGGNGSVPHREEAADAGSPDGEPQVGLAQLLAHAGELVGHVRTLLALRAKRRRLVVRRAVTIAIVVLLAAVALLPLIAAASALLAAGLAQGFTELWGGREWLGQLSAGAAILTGVGGAVGFAVRRASRRGIAALEAELGELEGDPHAS